MIGFLYRLVARAVYLILLLLFGLPFAALKWVLTGTRGGRERRAIRRELKRQRKDLRRAAS